jgi:hypothetical protein
MSGQGDDGCVSGDGVGWVIVRSGLWWTGRTTVMQASSQLESVFKLKVVRISKRHVIECD